MTQLCKSLGDKATILLIWMYSIKKIASLNEEVNTLLYSIICCLRVLGSFERLARDLWQIV